jgi:hypothetical protein
MSKNLPAVCSSVSTAAAVLVPTRATSIATFPLAVEAPARAVPVVTVVALLVRLDAVLVLVVRTLIAVEVVANVVTDVVLDRRRRMTEDLWYRDARERQPKSLTLRWTTIGVVALLPMKVVLLHLVRTSLAASLKFPQLLEERTTTWAPHPQLRKTTLTLWSSRRIF